MKITEMKNRVAKAPNFKMVDEVYHLKVVEIKPRAEEAIRQNGGKIKKTKEGRYKVEMPVSGTENAGVRLPCGCIIKYIKWYGISRSFVVHRSLELVARGNGCTSKKHATKKNGFFSFLRR